MGNELQRIMSAVIQILFIILLPSIWWFLTVRGKVPFMEWMGLKAIKRVKTLQLILWMVGGFSLFTIFFYPYLSSYSWSSNSHFGFFCYGF